MADETTKISPDLVRIVAAREGWSWQLIVPDVPCSSADGAPSKTDLVLASEGEGGAGLLLGSAPLPLGLRPLVREPEGVKVLLGRLARGSLWSVDQSSSDDVDFKNNESKFWNYGAVESGNDNEMVAGEMKLTDLAAVASALDDRRAPPRLPSAEDLARRLRRSVRGQDFVLSELARRAVLHAARPAPRRPLSVFAVGPTGVGKTLTAETLAESLASASAEGDGWGYLRLDMSEYGEAHRVSQLLGAPPGYTGHAEGSELLDHLEDQPRTLVLFDEIEKAHPSILRTLMNAMDAGRLSRSGRGQVDCRRAIFFFTSNAAEAELTSALSAGDHDSEAIEALCRRVLVKDGIAPELVGRISCFLVFKPLDAAAQAEVAALSIARVAGEYGLELSYVEPELVAELLTKTKTSSLGARPLTYSVDKLFGEAFLAATRERWSGTWQLVAGPPALCLPVGGPDV